MEQFKEIEGEISKEEYNKTYNELQEKMDSTEGFAQGFFEFSEHDIGKTYTDMDEEYSVMRGFLDKYNSDPEKYSGKI